MLILKSQPILKLIPLSEEEYNKVCEDMYLYDVVKIRNMELPRTTFVSIGTFMTTNTNFVRKIVHGTNTPDIVVDPLGRLISSSRRKYWWNYETNEPMFNSGPRKSLISAFKATETKYALIVKPRMEKIEDARDSDV